MGCHNLFCIPPVALLEDGDDGEDVEEAFAEAMAAAAAAAPSVGHGGNGTRSPGRQRSLREDPRGSQQ